MTEKTAKQIENMKKRRFGCEVECNHITREKAAQVAAEFFGTRRYEYTARRNGYETWSAWDQEGREWKFQRDASIPGPDSQRCEVVSPILTYDDLELLQELMRCLRKAGTRSCGANGMGVHIHIDAANLTPQNLRTLTNIMASHETLIAEALRLSEDRLARWCRVVDPTFLAELNKKKPKSMAAFAEIWYRTNGGDNGIRSHYDQSRYHFCNFHATFTKGTVEFRGFEFEAPADGKQNGIHAGRLKAYIQFALALVQASTDLRTASPKEPQRENPRYAMRTFLLRLGLIGDEFATCRDFLTRNLSGDAAFRHGRPAA